MPIRHLARRSVPLLCGLLLVGAAARAVTLKDRFEQTVPLKPGSEVHLGNSNGGVAFEAWDRNEVHIVAEKQVRAGSDDQARKLMSQIKIDVVPGPSGLRIETHMPKREESGGFLSALFNNDEVNLGVSYKVQVPRHVALDVVSSNGALSVTGTLGNTHLKTSNGGLSLTEVSGDMTLEASNGAVSVVRSAGSLRAATNNGGINAELRSLSGRDLSLETTNGGVTVHLPRGARFTVDAETSNGGVHSDFQVDGGTPGKHSLQGTVNGGGTRLHIRTSNGGVHIKEI